MEKQPGYNAQPPMAMTAAHPPGAKKEYNADGIREWNNGICTNCCGAFWWLSCCLPCLAYGKNRSRYIALQRDNRPHAEGGEMFASDGVVFALVQCFTGCGPILECFNRGEVRKRYAIKGNGCIDCLTVCCCGPCGMTQIDLELQAEEDALRASGVAAGPLQI